MFRMENPDLAETQPTPTGPQPESSTPQGSTQPVRVGPAADLDATQPTPASPEPGSHSYEAAAPEPAAAPPSGAAIFTAPGGSPPGEPPAGPPTVKQAKMPRKRPLWPLFTVIGILLLALVASASAYAGYNSGIELRTEAEASQRIQTIQQQYELGVQEMDSGQYFRARQRFEYVIQMDPNYPGVTERLAAVLMELNTTATPTVMPTPTLTPTPDLRGVEELFSQGQQYLQNQEWTPAMETLLTLRKHDPTYRMVEIDGMLFLALRNRGMDKIGKQADLEGGIYDLTLASKFGPLDRDANGYLTWASLYITGASFWELDWKQAVNYFEQVAPQLPYLRDASNMTAIERYRQALVGYGDKLMEGEQWCDAVEQYEKALEVGATGDVETALNEAIENCDNPDGSDGEDADVDEDADGDVDADPPAEGEPPVEEEPTAEEEPPTEEPTAEPPAE